MKKIIAIDDDLTTLELIKAICSKLKLDVTLAINGSGLLTEVSTGKCKYSLILLDWEMPQVSGFDILKRVRSYGFNVPIVMVTSKKNPDEIKKAMELKISGYIVKPIDINVLGKKIVTLCK